jgi:hypothetical protein
MMCKLSGRRQATWNNSSSRKTVESYLCGEKAKQLPTQPEKFKKKRQKPVKGAKALVEEEARTGNFAKIGQESEQGPSFQDLASRSG